MSVDRSRSRRQKEERETSHPLDNPRWLLPALGRRSQQRREGGGRGSRQVGKGTRPWDPGGNNRQRGNTQRGKQRPSWARAGERQVERDGSQRCKPTHVEEREGREGRGGCGGGPGVDRRGGGGREERLLVRRPVWRLSRRCQHALGLVRTRQRNHRRGPEHYVSEPSASRQRA